MGNQPEDRDLEARNPINDLYRLAETDRWHLVHMNRKQSVAEHSFFVALLAMRVAAAIGAPVGRAVQYALLHDGDEAWMGDTASPVKVYLDQSKFPIDKMMGDMHIWNVAPIVRSIVKICDDVEAIKFLRKYGDSEHATQVRGKLEDKLWEFVGNCCNEYPKFDWDSGLAEINFFINDTDTTHIDDYINWPEQPT